MVHSSAAGVYGPRDTDIFEFFKMASRGVAAIPAGERWLTMAYVADVVRAVLAAAVVGAHGEIYHLGEPSPQRLDHLFEQLAEAGGCRVRIVPIPAATSRRRGGGKRAPANRLAADAADAGKTPSSSPGTGPRRPGLARRAGVGRGTDSNTGPTPPGGGTDEALVALRWPH